MALNSLLDELLEDNREMLSALDQEARLYSGILLEKAARQMDLAYRDELTAVEGALARAEARIGELESRLAALEETPGR